MYCYFYHQLVLTRVWPLNCYEGWAEREIVKDVWGERLKFHFCIQVPYTFWRREVNWVWADLWFSWECEEVWAQVQAYQGNLILLPGFCMQWLMSVICLAEVVNDTYGDSPVTIFKWSILMILDEYDSSKLIILFLTSTSVDW